MPGVNVLKDQVDEFFADLPADLRPDESEANALMRAAVAEHIRQLKQNSVIGLFNYKMTMKTNEPEQGARLLGGLRTIKSQLRIAHAEWAAIGGSVADEELEPKE